LWMSLVTSAMENPVFGFRFSVFGGAGLRARQENPYCVRRVVPPLGLLAKFRQTSPRFQAAETQVMGSTLK